MIIYVEHVYCLTNNKSKKICAHSTLVIAKCLAVVVAVDVVAAVAFCYFANGNNDGVTVNVFSVYGYATLSFSLSRSRLVCEANIFRAWQQNVMENASQERDGTNAKKENNNNNNNNHP